MLKVARLQTRVRRHETENKYMHNKDIFKFINIISVKVWIFQTNKYTLFTAFYSVESREN
jgi:hypothetical protein